LKVIPPTASFSHEDALIQELQNEVNLLRSNAGNVQHANDQLIYLTQRYHQLE
jgi:hypothetical protein